jgi:hypothetical protein
MDWTVLVAVVLASGYAGYVIGVLVRGRIVDGKGGGGEPPGDPAPDSPSVAPKDFDLWELEVAARPTPRA